MKRIAIVVVAALAVSGAAFAAWEIFNPVSGGTAVGGFATAPSTNDITFSTGTGTATAVVPCTAGSGASCTGGTPGVIPVAVTNNDPTNAHSASGVSVVLTAVTGCASHLFVVSTSGLTQTVPGGTTAQGASVTYVADPSTPTSCSGNPVTANISGTAS